MHHENFQLKNSNYGFSELNVWFQQSHPEEIFLNRTQSFEQWIIDCSVSFLIVEMARSFMPGSTHDLVFMEELA